MTTSPLLEGLPVYCTHDEWELHHPADREAARNLADSLADRGLPVGRTFPCLGALIDLEPGNELATVRCGACTFETTFRRPKTVDPDSRIESATTREGWAF